MQQLLDQLNSRKPEIRDAALRDARALPPDDLLQLLLLESRLRRIRTRRFRVVFFTTIALFMLSMYIMPDHLYNEPLGKWFSRFALFAMFLSSELGHKYKDKYYAARQQFYQLLQNVEDLRFVAKILHLNNEHENDGLREAAKRLLPQIKANQAAQWSKEDKAVY